MICMPKLNFLSLMLALFGGTASLPHILIRYYTVKDQAAARKSTVVGIASIGFFYLLTLFMGLARHDQRRDRRVECQQQHGRAAVGQEFWRVAVRHDLGDRLYHGAGHGQRLDRGRQRRGRARPADQRRGIATDRSRKSARRQMDGRRGRTVGDRSWELCSSR